MSVQPHRRTIVPVPARLTLVFVLVLAAVAPPAVRSAAAAPLASVVAVDLGLFGGQASQANDINDAGQIVGTYQRSDNSTRGYVWQNGVTAELRPSGRYYQSDVQAINERGHAAGRSFSSQGRPATLWRDNKPFDLDPQLVYAEMRAFDINEHDQVVGTLVTKQATEAVFLWRSGVVTSIGAPGSDFRVGAINEHGQVVGDAYDGASGTRKAFIWHDGTFTTLAVPDGATFSAAGDINNDGASVGFYYDNGPQGLEAHATLWRGGTRVELETPEGWSDSQAEGINESGQVVGTARGPDAYHAVLWQADGSFVDLGANRAAVSINNRGQIVGYSYTSVRDDFPEARRSLLWVLDGAANLVNGGFELDANRDNAPDIWSANALATKSSAARHSSSYSLRLRSDSNRDVGVWQAMYGVRAGAQYDVAAWVNIPQTSDQFTFSVNVAWKDRAGTQLQVETVKSWSAQTGWSQGVKTLTAPSGAEQAVLRLQATNLAATVYIDDVVFTARR